MKAGFPVANAINVPIIAPPIIPDFDFVATVPMMGGIACAAAMAKTMRDMGLLVNLIVGMNF